MLWNAADCSTYLHAGASGGAVIDRSGQLVGLVTSNARHSRTGSSLPNLNFSLTAHALRPLWQLLQGARVRPQQGTFEQLDITSSLLQSVWALTPHSDHAGQGKGGAALQRLQHLLQQGALLDAKVLKESRHAHSRL